ncbi:MAG: prenyltransferase [Acidimicrobiia bacterium]|nr:prenyltransferase [Acidimicrobiia bacterium]
MAALRAFLRLTRPVFLLGGALLYGLGAALSTDPIVWPNYALGQAMVTAIQLAAQYANEYFDVEADRQAGERRTWLTGGSGVLAGGRLAPITARRAAVFTSVVSLALAIAVGTISGWAALVGLLALAGSWLYSAPPMRLVASRYGVAMTSVIVAVLTPVTGALVQGSAPVDRVIVVVAPLFLLHNAMLIAFERPDVPGDTAAGKLTLSVRLGPMKSAQLHAAFIGAALAAQVLAIQPGPLSWVEGGWALGLAPLGALQVGWFSRTSDTLLATGGLGLFGGTVLCLLGGLR